MIRRAAFTDIPRIYALMEEMYARSKYAGRGSIDAQKAKGLLMTCIQRHGAPGDGGTLVMVAEKEGAVVGFIIGILEGVYHIGRELMATDLYFYVSPKGNAGDAGALLDAVIQWAKSNPRVIELCFGVTDAIGDYQKPSALYRRRGFKQAGAMWEIALEREAQRSVA